MLRPAFNPGLLTEHVCIFHALSFILLEAGPWIVRRIYGMVESYHRRNLDPGIRGLVHTELSH